MIAAQPVKRTKFTAVVTGRKSSGAPRRTNPAATVLLGYLNPERKPMQKTKAQKAKSTIRRPAKPNPFIKAKAFSVQPWKKNGNRKPPRRKNPLSISGILGKPVELLKAGAIGAIAYFVTRQVPQAVLKARNTSWMGYGANLLTALGSAAVADKYFGPTAGTAAFVGGGMYLVGRVANDQTPFGKTLNLQGLGDPAARGGLRGLVPAFFPSPAIVDRSGQPVMAQYQPIVDAAVAQMPVQPPAAGMAGGRFSASRFGGRSRAR